jgi:pyridoxamine 5'-phosphate oxidase
MDPDPIRQFERWFRDAGQTGTSLPNAMTLATVNREGMPSARFVLLKEVDGRGFVFYTNEESRKGRELQENPVAALVFWWPALSRQVRVEGRVEGMGAAAADRYFASRQRGNQLGAHASPQSRVIPDRAFLEERLAEAARTFEGRDVPRPPHWGGYRLVPELLEFWQEGENRLHDRLRYRRDDGGHWLLERLAP